MTKSESIKALRERCRLLHYSLKTEDAYVGWVGRYCDFVASTATSLTPAEKVQGFLTAIAQSGCSASTQNQAFNALLFLYRNVIHVDLGKVDALRAKRPSVVRRSPSRAEIDSLLRSLRDLGGYPTSLVVRMLYGCGLRVSEPLGLRIKDVDLDRARLCIKGAKGGKDRSVAIPKILLPAIDAQVRQALAAWEKWSSRGLGVAMPDALARKYPSAHLSKPWFWLFPAQRPCTDPRSGRIVLWRMHEANIQRCVKAAVRLAGLASDITPHSLRHAWGTHAMEMGGHLRDIQAHLGHASLETTMTYLSPDLGRLPEVLTA